MMTSFPMDKRFKLALLASSILMSSVASAQSSDQMPASAAAASGEAAPGTKALSPASDTPANTVAHEALEPALSGDIVVTARKRNESLQKVPVAVTAFTADMLRQKTIQRVYDLATNTPGLTIRAASGDRTRPDFFIRGQGSTYGTQPGVVVYFADAPSFTPLYPGTNIQFYDLGSVQVLKGPQGTLFGRSTIGGAVLLAPQRPTNEFGGYLDASAGNYAYKELSGALNVPIIKDVLSLRVAGDIVRRDGFTRSITTDQRLDDRHQESYRIGLLFKPAKFFENYTLFYGTNVNENSTGAALLEYNPNLALFNTSASGAGRATATSICNATNPGNAAAALSCINTRVGRLNALAAAYQAEVARRATGGASTARNIPTALNDYVRGKVQTIVNETTISPGRVPLLGDLTIKNIFSTSRVLGGASIRELGGIGLLNAITFNGNDLINNVPTVTRAVDIKFLDNYTEEAQLGGKSGPVTWLVGYYREQNNRPIQYPSIFPTFNDAFTVPLDRLPTTGTFTLNSKSLNQGYFGQATVTLARNLNFTAGYRVSTVHQSYFSAVPIETAAGVAYSIVVKQPTDHENVNSYNFSLDYQATRDVLVYATTRKGYKAGGVNAAPSVPVPSAVATYKPEILKDVEVGAKSQWRAGSFHGRSNIAAYYQWYTDVQRSQTVALPSPAVGIYTQTNNIAAAKIYGAELENTVQVGRWTLTATYSFTHAAYSKYPGTVTDIAGVVHQLINSPFIGTPKHQATLGLRYLAVSTPDIGDVSVSGELYAQSRVHLDDQEIIDPLHVGDQKGYVNLNLRLGWDHVFSKPLDASFFVRNATDNLHLVSVSNFLNTLGAATGVYNEPRTWGFELRYRFGAEAR